MSDKKPEVKVSRNLAPPLANVVGVNSKDMGFTAKQGDKSAVGRTASEARANLAKK